MSIDRPTLPSVATPTTFPLLAELLAEQQRLQTPVARFASSHAALSPVAAGFRELIPLSAPGPGEQYAFEVDLDRCTGCKSCVAGCHSLNGLDDEETWRDVGLLLGGDAQAPYQQTLTTACHHCADPGCLNGCPVLAYEKDPLTGIVRHLDDQCIGCQYCVLKCPYDVPKYNARLGIVRKCDLCHSRLAEGEAPACVQACPTEAIRIVRVKAGQPSEHFPAAAPAPSYTQPTTRYVSKLPIPSNAHAADRETLRVQPAHLPLVVMLVCTQVGLGALAGAAVFAPTSGLGVWGDLAGTVLFLLGLVASVAHLGQPLRAWRIFLNLRRSWLSREAVLFGTLLPPLSLYLTARHGFAPSFFERGAALFSAILAGAALVSSAMIYVDTRRHAWRLTATALRFGGTFAVTALAWLSPSLGAVALLLLVGGEAATALRLTGAAPFHATRRLLLGPLAASLGLRVSLALVAAAAWSFDSLWLGFLPFLFGQFVERKLYFRSVDAPKMPGVPAA